MKNEFILTVTDFFKILGNQTCMVGYIKPEFYPMITSEYICEIIVDGIKDRSVNIIGQDRLARQLGAGLILKQSIRTLDNLDDLFPLINTNNIILTGFLP